MLKKINRLTAEEFKKLGKPSRMLHSVFFSVRLHPTQHKQPKFAVVVSKKIAPTAVTRNLLRRRFYELSSENIGAVSSGTAVVIFVKKEANKASFQDLKNTIEKLGVF